MDKLNKNSGAHMNLDRAFIDSNTGAMLQAFIDDGGCIVFENCFIEKFTFDARKSVATRFTGCRFQACELYLSNINQVVNCVLKTAPHVEANENG